MNDSQREAIANADAHTSNAVLPTYSELAQALRGLGEWLPILERAATHRHAAGSEPALMLTGEIGRTRALLARIPT